MKSKEPKVLKPKTIKNVAKFIQELLENEEMNTIGAVKIIPPEPLKLEPMNEESVLPGIDRQTVTALKMVDNKPALFEMKYEKVDPMDLREFKNIAAKMSSNANDEVIEEAMWESLCKRATRKPKSNPVCATEWTDSLIQNGDRWKINNFTEEHSILNVNAIEDRIPGIQSSFSIVGMRDTWFCAHKEDSDLASINCHLYGAPKVWYVIQPKDATRFEKLFHDIFCDDFEYTCSTALRHKCFVIPPWVLDAHEISYTIYVQRPGEIMLTLYGAYHFGFNAGFNICEASNIASPKFLNIFEYAKLCQPSCPLHQQTNVTKTKLLSLLNIYISRNRKSQKKTQIDAKSTQRTSSNTKSTKKQFGLLTKKQAEHLKPIYRRKVGTKIDKDVCKLCNSTFNRNSNLVKHNQIYHAAKIERHKCSECDYMAPDNSAVENHQKSMHKGCQNMTISKVTLKNTKIDQKNRLMKLLKQPKRICVRKEKVCEICGKKVIGTSSLKRHMVNTHGVNSDNGTQAARLFSEIAL